MFGLLIIEVRGKQVQRQPFWEPVARNDREPWEAERKAYQLKDPLSHYSAIIKAHKGKGTQCTGASMERQCAVDNAAKIGNH